MRLECPHCGHETVVSVSYCPACGEKMPAPAEAPKEEATEPSAAPDTPPDEPEPEAEPQPESPPEPDTAATPPQPSVVTMPPTVAGPATPPAPPPGEPPPSPAAPPTEGATPPAAPPTPQPPTPPAPVPPATAPVPPKKGKSPWWWVCGGCGCLAIVIAIIVGIALFRVGLREGHKVSSEAEQADGPAEAVVTESEGAGEVSGEAQTVEADEYVVTVPSNWERDQQADEDVLKLLGPEVNGERLDLQIWVEQLAEDVSLKEFSDDVLEQYAGIGRTEDTYEASLCDEPARRVAFTADDHDYLIYLSVYKAQGFVIVMIAPEGTMGTEEATFDQVLDEFAMYE